MRLPWERWGAGYCPCGSVLDRRWHGFTGHTPDGKRRHLALEAESRASLHRLLDDLRYSRAVPYEVDPGLTIPPPIIRFRPWYVPKWWWTRMWMFKPDASGRYPILLNARRHLGVW